MLVTNLIPYLSVGRVPIICVYVLILRKLSLPFYRSHFSNLQQIAQQHFKAAFHSLLHQVTCCTFCAPGSCRGFPTVSNPEINPLWGRRGREREGDDATE